MCDKLCYESNRYRIYHRLKTILSIKKETPVLATLPKALKLDDVLVVKDVLGDEDEALDDVFAGDDDAKI